jgi:hypothetical protein
VKHHNPIYMIAVVEDYIYKRTGKQVTIDKNIVNDPQQLMKLHIAFQTANEYQSNESI